jgi:hypothetical protein
MTSQKLPGRPRASYGVGYAKPPSANRFKPGQSGNPKGRPKGAKNKLPALHEERLREIVLEEAYRTITVQDGGRRVGIPMAQAVIRAMAVNAAKGQHRAQRLFSELLGSTEAARKQLHDSYFETALTYKLEWDQELQRRAAQGITNLPDPLPHPDQVILDMDSGTVQLKGPLTREEKATVDHWQGKAEELRETLEELKENLKTQTDPEERVDIIRHIDVGEDLLKRMTGALER